jgi:DNA-binding LacI/PurR family transcriptional regulator
MVKTLDDIARLAGVSRATVSRAINNAPDVNEATRQKILHLIQEQEFRPNTVARALATQRTRVISLVIPKSTASIFTDPFFPIISTVILTARQNEYAFMMWMNDGSEAEEQFCERILNNSLSDGILLSSSLGNDPLFDRLVKTDYPFVVIGAPPYGAKNVSFVNFNDIAGAREATAYLIRLEHQRIGIITGPLNTLPARDRLMGYQSMLREAGYSLDEHLIVEGDYTVTSGYRNMNLLLEEKVDAVFATSDIMALGAIRAIQEHGLSVPEDISVIGYDDLFVAGLASPALTTISQPTRQMAAQATQLLVDQLEGKLNGPRQVTLPVTLTIRETCRTLKNPIL